MKLKKRITNDNEKKTNLGGVLVIGFFVWISACYILIFSLEDTRFVWDSFLGVIVSLWEIVIILFLPMVPYMNLFSYIVEKKEIEEIRIFGWKIEVVTD